MTTNSLIDRPELYIELENAIGENANNAKPWIELQSIYEEFDKVQQKIKQSLPEPNVNLKVTAISDKKAITGETRVLDLERKNWKWFSCLWG